MRNRSLLSKGSRSIRTVSKAAVQSIPFSKLLSLFSFPLFLLFLLVQASTMEAQTINATQKDVIIIDNGASGKADPNDRIRYDVTIQNTAGASGTDVQLNIVPDPRTTFVAGSYRSSPLALNDTYACTGNVGLNVPAVSGLKANDFDDNIAGANITAGTFATTGGGSIMIVADGSFMYIPPAGQFTGTDTYTYTLTDGNGVGAPVPNTDMATVTFTISNLIYFIDNSSVAATSDGRLTSPFKNLADFQAGSGAPANVIYMEETGTNYSGTLALAANEKLFGTGHNGGANLANVLGFSVAAFSKTLPAISGTRPVIVNPSGGGIVLNSGNTVRGLNVGNCLGFGIDDNGLSVGSLTISQVAINNGSAGGYRNAFGGTLAVTLDNVTATASISGIMLTNTSGSFAVTGATIISNSTGTGLSLSGNSTNISFNTITVGGTVADGIFIGGQTGSFTATGLTTVNAPLAGTGFSINIGTGTGALSFANIDINGRRSSGININLGSRAIITGTVDIDNTNNSADAALSISGTTGGNSISFGATTINNNGAAGNCIFINAAAQPVSFASGSAISNSSGSEFSVNGGAGNITYNGSVTNTSGGAVTISGRTGGIIDLQGTITHNAAAVGISVNSNAGGSMIFSGGTKTLNSSTANAVNLTTNGTSTINFTNGGLAITTSSGVGFNATGGATAVNVTGSNNTISSGTATALNVVSTNIGASNLNFLSISAGTAASGPASGIILNSTGSGGLIVSGNSGGSNDGSGGTIQKTSGPGVNLTSASGISLNYMNIATSGDDGIRGLNVAGFTMNRTNVTNNGNAVGDRGIEILNLTGACSMSNCSVSGSAEANMRIENDGGNLSSFNITNTFIGNTAAATGDDGILLLNNGNGAMVMSVTNSTFTDNKGDHFQAASDADASGTINVTFNNNVLTTTPANDPNILGGGITINTSGTLDIVFQVNNNNIQQAFDDAININLDPGSQAGASMIGTISGNTIGTAGDLDSGSESSNCITVGSKGQGTTTISIINNTIRQWSNSYGIFLQSSEGSSLLNATVTGNSLKNPGSFAINGFHAAAGATGPDNGTICLVLTGNDMTASAKAPPSDTDVRLRQRFNTTIKLPGYGGANNDSAAVNAFVSGNNTGGPTVSSINNVGGGGFGYIGGAPCPTN